MPPLAACAYGEGHIHDTYKLTDALGQGYILQRINHSVFKEPHALMENILGVTSYLKQKGYLALEIIETYDKRLLFTDASGQYWRLYRFIQEGLSLSTEAMENEGGLVALRAAGLGFGRFLAQLVDYPVSALHEVIRDFHHTPLRWQHLEAAYRLNPLGRSEAVRADFDFARQFEQEVWTIVGALREGRLPLRVTHNDTKVNNVLLNPKTLVPVCVVDLDTLMPGSALYDFGDGIRSCAATAAEDEENLAAVQLDLNRFRAFTEGYLEGAGRVLTQEEIDLLPMGALLMTLECGMRFLTDYLQGDLYFKVTKPDHNLVRARNQFKLVQEIVDHYEALRAIVGEGLRR